MPRMKLLAASEMIKAISPSLGFGLKSTYEGRSWSRDILDKMFDSKMRFLIALRSPAETASNEKVWRKTLKHDAISNCF